MNPQREKELRALAYDFPVYDELFREIDRLRLENNELRIASQFLITVADKIKKEFEKLVEK